MSSGQKWAADQEREEFEEQQIRKLSKVGYVELYQRLLELKNDLEILDAADLALKRKESYALERMLNNIRELV